MKGLELTMSSATWQRVKLAYSWSEIPEKLIAQTTPLKSSLLEKRFAAARHRIFAASNFRRLAMAKKEEQSQPLKSWREIAAYLGQPISVAQRWAHEGMP